MPIIIPATVKLAITGGALMGASVAILANKEAVLSYFEKTLRNGADYCKDKLDKLNKKQSIFADAHEDGYYNPDYSLEDSSGMSTPNTDSDIEILYNEAYSTSYTEDNNEKDLSRSRFSDHSELK